MGIECSKYSGHSFRIGAATTAVAEGILDSLIQMGECGISVLHEDTKAELPLGLPGIDLVRLK